MRIKSPEKYHLEKVNFEKNPENFWEEKAKKFVWYRKWDEVLNWDFKTANVEWFKGGKLNITENCLDRHLQNNGNRIAIKWIANNPNEKI